MTAPARPGAAVSARRLWAGGAVAGLVAALIVVVGVLVCRAILDVPVLAPERDSAWRDSDTAWYALGAALAALLATGLMQVLLLSTSRPHTIFIQVVSLATLVAAQAPFDITADTDTQIALAIINLVLGAAIGMLVDWSARRAVRPVPLPGGAGRPVPRFPTGDADERSSLIPPGVLRPSIGRQPRGAMFTRGTEVTTMAKKKKDKKGGKNKKKK